MHIWLQSRLLKSVNIFHIHDWPVITMIGIFSLRKDHLKCVKLTSKTMGKSKVLFSSKRKSFCAKIREITNCYLTCSVINYPISHS